MTVVILTHGRPKNQLTLKSLRRAGYTGDVVLLLDNEDKSIPEYVECLNSGEYGDKVEIVVFDKQAVIMQTDTAESRPFRQFAVFARNAAELLAKERGWDYFCACDDDIIKFRHRYDDGEHIRSMIVTDFDSVLKEHLKLLEFAGVATMSFGITSSFMLGQTMDLTSSRFRICFNFYLRNTEYTVDWSLNMWEDVITSVLCNMRGQVWLQSPYIQMDMMPISASNSGGNSDVYKVTSKFRQEFYTIVACPSVFALKYRTASGNIVPMTHYDNVCGKIISNKYRRLGNATV